MNHKIQHLKGLQRTAPNRLGAQTSTQCTRTLCLPPTTFLSMFLRSKICFAYEVGTQIITRFPIKMNHKISQMKELQGTTPKRLGAQTSAQCSTTTLCLPPTTFLLMWLRNKICFAYEVGTQITRFLTRDEPQNVSFERVAGDNTRQVRCTNICIVYQNIVLASYKFFVHVVAE